MTRLAFHWPSAGDRVAGLLFGILPLYERLRLRFRWRARLDNLLSYWYWRGIAESMDRAQYRQLAAREEPRLDRLTIDLSRGLAAAAAELDRQRPMGVDLVYGDRAIGSAWGKPGMEPLRGAHLRPMVTERFSLPLARAAAEAGSMNGLVGRSLMQPFRNHEVKRTGSQNARSVSMAAES